MNSNYLRLIGIIIFVGILWYVDLGKLYSVLTDGAPAQILLGFGMVAPLSFVRSFRWNRIKNTLRIQVPIRWSFYYQLVGQVAFLTPGKAGELIKAVYLKKSGYSFSRSVFSVLLDRLFDVITVSAIALSSLLLFFTEIKGHFVLLSAGIILLFSFITFFGIARNTNLLNFIGKRISGIIPENWNLTTLLASAEEYFANFSLVFGLEFIGLSLVAYCLQVLRIFILAQSINIPVSFSYLLGVVALMSLGNILPVSISGLGTRDAVFIYFLGLSGISSAAALSLSLLVLTNIVINMLFGSLLFTIYPPTVD